MLRESGVNAWPAQNLVDDGFSTLKVCAEEDGGWKFVSERKSWSGGLDEKI